MKIIKVTQGSEEWHQCRVGKITASKFDKIITSQGKPSKQRDKYLNKKVAERIKNTRSENIKTKSMERGAMLEPEAKLALAMIRGYEITEVGILQKNEWVQCSPDGLIYDQDKLVGATEIKCPEDSTQIEYLKANKIPAKYIPQVQGYFYCCSDLKWLDFFSYCPGLPPLLIRTYPDRIFLEKLDKEINRASEYLKKTVEQIKRL